MKLFIFIKRWTRNRMELSVFQYSYLFIKFIGCFDFARCVNFKKNFFSKITFVSWFKVLAVRIPIFLTLKMFYIGYRGYRGSVTILCFDIFKYLFICYVFVNLNCHFQSCAMQLLLFSFKKEQQKRCF